MFNCYIEDGFIVIVYHDTNQSSREILAQDLIHKVSLIIENAPVKDLVFAFQGEPLNKDFYNKIFSVVPSLQDAYPYCNVKIFTGIEPTDENYQHYLNMCNVNNWKPIEVVMSNNWEAALGKNTFLHDQSIPYTATKRQKVFLNLNAGIKYHRLHFMAEVLHRGLFDKGYMSFLGGGGGTINGTLLAFLQNQLNLKKYFPKRHTIIAETMIKNINLFPLILDNQPDPNNMTDWLTKHQHSSNNLLKFYNDSYLSVVSETTFYSHHIVQDGDYDAVFFSEKTWKPISLNHPFIIGSNKNSLATLRKKGYQTFTPFINESYDDLEGEERTLAIVEELERLSKQSDEEWMQWQENVKPMVEHNHQHLKYMNKITKTYTGE